MVINWVGGSSYAYDVSAKVSPQAIIRKIDNRKYLPEVITQPIVTGYLKVSGGVKNRFPLSKVSSGTIEVLSLHC